MNMEDLTAYRQRLLENKKYVPIRPGNATHEISDLKTAEEIIAQDNTMKAVSLIEKSVEKTIEYMAMRDYNYDVIEMAMYFECYVTEGTVKYINENFMQARPLSERISLKRFNILDGYVRFCYGFRYLAKNKDYEYMKDLSDKSNPQYYIEQETDTSIEGIVINYNDFVQKIKELGYSISIEDFESIKEQAKAGEYLVPTITLDFRTRDNVPQR